MHYKNLQIIATKFIKTVIDNYRMNLFTSGLVPSALIIHECFPSAGPSLLSSRLKCHKVVQWFCIQILKIDSHPGDNYWIEVMKQKMDEGTNIHPEVSMFIQHLGISSNVLCVFSSFIAMKWMARIWSWAPVWSWILWVGPHWCYWGKGGVVKTWTL